MYESENVVTRVNPGERVVPAFNRGLVFKHPCLSVIESQRLGGTRMAEQSFNPLLHNLRQMIRNLEYLLEVADTPAEKARYQARLNESKKSLESMAGPEKRLQQSRR